MDPTGIEILSTFLSRLLASNCLLRAPWTMAGVGSGGRFHPKRFTRLTMHGRVHHESPPFLVLIPPFTLVWNCIFFLNQQQMQQTTLSFRKKMSSFQRNTITFRPSHREIKAWNWRLRTGKTPSPKMEFQWNFWIFPGFFLGGNFCHPNRNPLRKLHVWEFIMDFRSSKFLPSKHGNFSNMGIFGIFPVFPSKQKSIASQSRALKGWLFLLVKIHPERTRSECWQRCPRMTSLGPKIRFMEGKRWTSLAETWCPKRNQAHVWSHHVLAFPLFFWRLTSILYSIQFLIFLFWFCSYPRCFARFFSAMTGQFHWRKPAALHGFIVDSGESCVFSWFLHHIHLFCFQVLWFH